MSPYIFSKKKSCAYIK